MTLTFREEHGLRVFENRLLWRICWCKRNVVRGKWRRWHKQELHDLYSSTTIVWIIKSKRMKWAGNVAYNGESRYAQRCLVGRPVEKKPFGRQGIDGRIILNQSSRNRMGGA